MLTHGLAREPRRAVRDVPEWEAASLAALADATGAVTIGFRAAGARARPARTRAWRRIRPRMRRSSSGARRWSTTSSAGSRSSWTLVIGGPSGSGKSSMLRAGLIPALTAGALPGSQHWHSAPVQSRRPTRSTSSPPARPPRPAAPDGRPTRARDPELRRRSPSRTHVLLAIDQFEELLTHDAATPIGRRSSTSSRPSSRSRTERSASCSRSAPTSTPRAAALPLVGRTDQQQPGARRADAARTSCGPIEGPALRAGLRLETGLIEAILDEAGNEPAALPARRARALETWLRRRGSLLAIDGFRAAGGVVGAIAQIGRAGVRTSRRRATRAAAGCSSDS